MKVHILNDDCVNKGAVLAELGLSMYIETKELNILFDLGQSDVYIHNAKNTGADLEKIDAIILSHGHYDHSGGLAFFPNNIKLPKIYAHMDTFTDRYSINGDGKTFRNISFKCPTEKFIQIKENINYIKDFNEIAPNIYLLGNIVLEDIGEVSENLYTGDGKEFKKDMFTDEQILVINTDKGLCVFVGCSHRGIINTIKYVKKIFPSKNINTLIGGMHLGRVSPSRVKKVIQYLKDSEIENIIPLHCTGISVICEMKKALNDRCQIKFSGDVFEI